MSYDNGLDSLPTEMNSDEQMDIEEELKEEARQIFKCGICHGLLDEPVSLMCQHTFCKKCLMDVVKHMDYHNNPSCPMCNKRFFLVELTNKNTVIESSLEMVCKLVFSEEEIDELMKEKRKDEMKLSMEEQVRKELEEAFMDHMPDPTPGHFIEDEDIDDMTYPPFRIQKSTFMSTLKGITTGEVRSMNFVLMCSLVGITGAYIYKMLKS